LKFIKFGFFQKLGVMLSFAVGGLVFATLISMNTTNQLIETDRRIIESYNRIRLYDEVLSALINLEVGQRGFLLTQDPDFLEPYEESIDDVYMLIDELVEGSSGGGQLRVDTLRFFADERILLLNRALALAEDGDFEGAIDQVQEGQGKQAMDEVRRIIAEGVAEEEQLLEVRFEVNRIAVRNQRYTSGALVCITAMVLVAAYQSTNKEIDRRQQAEAELEAVNNALNLSHERLIYAMQTSVQDIREQLDQGDDRTAIYHRLDQLIEESKRDGSN
jgi:CHASE3 domain sensor protein